MRLRVAPEQCIPGEHSFAMLISHHLNASDRRYANGSADSVSLRIRHTGFKEVHSRVWEKELCEWNLRLQSLDHTGDATYDGKR